MASEKMRERQAAADKQAAKDAEDERKAHEDRDGIPLQVGPDPTKDPNVIESLIDAQEEVEHPRKKAPRERAKGVAKRAGKSKSEVDAAPEDAKTAAEDNTKL